MPRAYQTDDQGVFIGAVTCHPDPLTPGRFAVPRGAILQEPPPVAEGQRVRWTGERWVIEDARLPLAPAGEAWTVQTLADVRHMERRAALQQAQEGGFTILLPPGEGVDDPPEPVTVDSDLRSQALLAALGNAARTALSAGDQAALDRIAGPLLRAGWRGRGGRIVARDASGIVALLDALADHIAACDEASLRVAADIDRLAEAGDLPGLLVYRVVVAPSA